MLLSLFFSLVATVANAQRGLFQTVDDSAITITPGWLNADDEVRPSNKPTYEKRESRPMENEFTDDGEKLWGGDMILTPEQADAWFGGGGGQSSVVDSRKAIGNLKARWPNARVPYRFDTSSVGDREAILKGLQHWTEHTCLTFNEVGGTPNYPHLIFEKGSGCWSGVGMSSENGQEISIGKNCADLGTVVHEVGHAIGFQHEQCRADRDQYVRINYENVEDKKVFNFNVDKTSVSHGVPYDYTSVMHYGSKSFSKNGKPTISVLDVTKTFLIDESDSSGLSFTDKKLANIIYNCSDRCGSSKPACQNLGFVDKNCRCVCPPEFDGDLCQNTVDVPGPGCGGRWWATGYFSSPNYPNKFTKKSRCVWVMYAPESNQRIRAEFVDFDLYKNKNDTCPWDYLEVRAGSDMTQSGTRYCSDELKGYYITSAGNRMVLLFKADNDTNKGFRIKFSYV